MQRLAGRSLQGLGDDMVFERGFNNLCVMRLIDLSENNDFFKLKRGPLRPK